MTKTKPVTAVASRACRLFLKILSRLSFLGGIDMGQILVNQAESVLNLPGALAFFPAKKNDAALVSALFQKLHPVRSDIELIRFGPAGDGGYLIPNDLEGIEACFSPGVSTISGFEQSCADRGMKVFMADHSVDGPPQTHEQFRFIKKYIGAASHGIFVSPDDWVMDSMPDRNCDLLLQMDIEGAEYESVLAMSMQLQKRFRIMVFEFHFLDYLFCEPLFLIFSKAFEKLLTTHTCVHIHPNNVCAMIKVGGLEIPQVAEFTFLRNDRVKNASFATAFPHPLDQDNTERAPIRLPASCYRQVQDQGASAQTAETLQ